MIKFIFILGSIIFLSLIAFIGYIKPRIEKEAKDQQKCEDIRKACKIMEEFAKDIGYLAVASEHPNKLVDPVKVLDILQEKISKIGNI